MVTTKKEKKKAKESQLEVFDPLADIEGIGEIFGNSFRAPILAPVTH